MNQCSRNRRRNTAMLFGQLVERRNGRRIAQHHGDLTPTSDAGGLALGTGLGFHSGRQAFGVVTAHVIRAAVSNFLAGPARHHLAIFAHNEGSISFSRHRDGGKHLGNLVSRVSGHGRFLRGTIPPMCESYAVTSDVSTTILQASA